jgi:hypothetical protein
MQRERICAKPESTKKPYESPRLEVYGDLAEITHSKHNSTSLDSGSGGPNIRTS